MGQSSCPPGAGYWNFLKLLKTMIVGLYGFVWVFLALGYFVFLNRIKNDPFFSKFKIKRNLENKSKIEIVK